MGRSLTQKEYHRFSCDGELFTSSKSDDCLNYSARCNLGRDRLSHTMRTVTLRCRHYSEYTSKSGHCNGISTRKFAAKTAESKLYHRKSQFLPRMWLQFALVSAVALFANAQDFQFQIEPSHQLIDPDGEAAVKYMQQKQFTEHPYAEDSGMFGRGNLRFFAVEGHLFNRSLVEELKKFDPNLLSEGDRIQVHFSSTFEPGTQWLIFRESSSLLQGVALPMHDGTHHFYVMIRHGKSPSMSTTTLPCTVEVFAEERAFELRQMRGNDPEVARLEAAYRCPHHEPVTAASIAVHADASAMSKSERVECLLALSTALEVPSDSVAMQTTPEATKNDRPFLSGPGNVPKAQATSADPGAAKTVILSWPLGCSSDLNDAIPGLERLEIAANDGSLARSIGYDITEWKIVNRVHRFRKLKRTKRQVGDKVAASANIFYPRASKLPLQGGENVRAVAGLETEETVGSLRRGRTRLDINMVRATPMPGMPLQASKMPYTLDRSIVPPSTPTIPKPTASMRPAPVTTTNAPPMVMFGFEDIHALLGTYMEYRIPADAIVDTEDQTARNLKLQVLDHDTSEPLPNEGSWPLFDSEAQLLYGVPTDDAMAEKKYILFAVDSGGKSCTFTFTVYVKKDKLKPKTHKFSFYFAETDATRQMTPDALFTSFGRKLAVALAKTENMPGDLTMVKTDSVRSGKQRYVAWFDSSLNSEDCEIEVRQKIKGAGILIAGDDAQEGSNKPTKEFSAKFKPEYKLKNVKIELLGSCVVTKPTPAPTSLPAEPTTLTPPTPAQPEIETPGTTPTTHTTTSSTTTTSTSTEALGGNMPRVVKPVPPLLVKTGRILQFALPMGTFEDLDDPGNDLKITMKGPTPPWLGFEPSSRTIYAMPTREDYENLESYNATHGMWKAEITAADKDGLISPPLVVKIMIQKETMNAAKKANHLFQVKIKNYDIKNFTAIDRLRIVRLVGDIFGDDDLSSIYLEPLRKGSVFFSWRNSTLAFIDPCPYEEIALLAQKLFMGGEVRKDVQKRFMENNFDFAFLNASRPMWCKQPKAIVKSTQPEAGTTGPGPGIATASGKSTSILIIAVVVVCLVLLIIILVVKCRMGKTAREKKRLQTEREQREQKARAAMMPSPDNSTSPRIKKGVPIIFQDEIAMEANGNAYASVSTPLMGSTSPSPNYRGNGDSRSPAVTMDDENIREETPFSQPQSHHPMTPPTPILSDRPPPPYVTPH